MQALSLGDLSATPWSVSPVWFALFAALVPALVWLVFAWRRALMECPNRSRRAGVREIRNLLKNMRRAGGAPRPAHLHAWLRSSARVWDVRSSAPSAAEVARAARSLSGDEGVSSRWRELYLIAEHGLYAPDAHIAPDWLDRATDAAFCVEMPRRERMFPNRLRHWLPNRPASGSRSRLFRLRRGASGDGASGGGRLLRLGRRGSHDHTTAGARLTRLGRSALSIAIAGLIATAATPPPADADVPWSSPVEATSTLATPSDMATSNDSAELESVASSEEIDAASESLPAEVQLAAQAALDANWNDWAAHHNLAAFQTQTGDLANAIAHATAAFAQHPAAATTRATLLTALGDTQTVDPTLRRLTSGPWYARIPALFSAASWQRLALLAALVTAAGLSAMIYAMYIHRPSQPSQPNQSKQPPLRVTGVSRLLPELSPITLGPVAFASGAVILAVAMTHWNAYGPLNQPTAATLLQNANMSPVPTDLVPTEETSPVVAGTVVVARRSFLGWQEITRGPDASGWVRSSVLMPLYARP